VIGYGAIFVGLWVLSGPIPGACQPEGNSESGEFVQGDPATRSRNALLVLSLLLVMVGSYAHFSRPMPIPLKADFEEFPAEIGRWKGIETPNDDNVYKKLGVDRDMSRFYKADSGQVIQLYIGYFESQTQGKELISYKLNDLFDGARAIELGIGGGRQLAVSERIVSARDRERITRFWYIINGRAVANKYWVKWYTVWDRLIHRRTNGAVVIVTAEVRGSDDRDVALTNSGEFIRVILPLVGQYVP
jgi:EpsI family protein